MDSIDAAVWVGRQAPVRVRQPQALVVQGVIKLPPELEIAALGPMEVLGEREVGIPESRGAATGWPQPRRAELPPGIEGVVIERRAIGIEARRDLLDHCRVRAKARRQRVRVITLILYPLDV